MEKEKEEEEEEEEEEEGEEGMEEGEDELLQQQHLLEPEKAQKGDAAVPLQGEDEGEGGREGGHVLGGAARIMVFAARAAACTVCGAWRL